MEQATIERWAKTGLSVSTAGTIFVFFIGQYYASGKLGAFGIRREDVDLEVRDIMNINGSSALLLWHLVLGYVGLIHLIGRRSSKSPGITERRIVSVWLLISVAAIIYNIGTGRVFQLVTIAVGTLLGYALAYSIRRIVTPDLKLTCCAVAFVIVLFHAREAGRRSAGQSVHQVTVTMKSTGKAIDYLQIYGNSVGKYMLEDTGGERRVRFLPNSEITEWSAERVGYESR